MHVTADDAAHWLPVRDAAKATGVPVRTIYSHIERKMIEARKLDGSTLHVQRAAVEQLVDPVAARANRGSAESPALAAARERVAVKHLEVQELTSEVAAERHRQELAQVEAEREQKRQLIGLQVARERFALERERDEYRRQEEEREERARREAQNLAAEHAASEERRRQVELDRAAAVRRRAWEDRWVVWAERWISNETGEWPDPQRADALVRNALKGLPQSSPDEVAENRLERRLRVELSDAIERRTSARLTEMRLLVATAAALGLAGPGQMARRILPSVVAAAEKVDPESAAGQVLIALAARTAYDAAKRADGIEQALQSHELEKKRRQQEWAVCRLLLHTTVRQALPPESTCNEIEEGVGILRDRLEREARYGDPKEFEKAAESRLWELRRRVKDRVDRERRARK
jgi:hypothetical protein